MENKKELIIKEYLSGKSQQQVARIAHCAARTVKKVIEEAGVKRTSKEVKEIAQKKFQQTVSAKYTPEQESIVLDCYVNQKRGQVYTCKQAGVSEKILKEILNKNGIHVRTFSEAATESNMNRAKYKNKEYFNTESHNMAWLLGFLASDGNVSKDDNGIKIALSSVDQEILEKIKEELEIENEIQEYDTYDGFKYSSLSWSCKEHKEALAKYSIVPNKTFILEPPYSLDRKYWIDYIRGYFDGDGSINLIKNSNGRGNGNLRWQVCSATRKIIEFIQNFFYEEYNIPKVNILTRNPGKEGEHPLYYIQYSSRATREIYKHLYTPNSLYLERKKKHYEEILSKVASLDDIMSHETAIS